MQTLLACFSRGLALEWLNTPLPWCDFSDLNQGMPRLVLNFPTTISRHVRPASRFDFFISFSVIISFNNVFFFTKECKNYHYIIMLLHISE